MNFCYIVFLNDYSALLADYFHLSTYQSSQEDAATSVPELDSFCGMLFKLVQKGGSEIFVTLFFLNRFNAMPCGE